MTSWDLTMIYFVPPAGVALIGWGLFFALDQFALAAAAGVLSALAIYTGIQCLRGKKPW